MDAAQKQQSIPDVTFKLQFGKTCTDVSMPLSATVCDLKEQAQQLLGIPPAMQKLLIKGSLKPDATTLQDAGVKKGLRVMLIGSRYPPELVYGLNGFDASRACVSQATRYPFSGSTNDYIWVNVGFAKPS